MPNDIGCFYHGADFDGHCSGAIVKKRFPAVHLHPIDYDEPFPWDLVREKYDAVYMVDFALKPFEDMVKLASVTDLIWIDHHKTAIKDYRASEWTAENRRPVLDTNLAGCELTWLHLYPENPLPLVVRLLGRYDVWDHGWSKSVLPFQYGLRMELDTFPETAMDLWNALIDDDGIAEDSLIKTITERGSNILKYDEKQTFIYGNAGAFDAKFDGLSAVCLNRGLMNSRMFDQVYSAGRHKVMFAFCWYKKRWKVGLYTTHKDVDVGELAKKHGGGGHAGAAGFYTDKLPLDLLEF